MLLDTIRKIMNIFLICNIDYNRKIKHFWCLQYGFFPLEVSSKCFLLALDLKTLSPASQWKVLPIEVNRYVMQKP